MLATQLTVLSEYSEATMEMKRPGLSFWGSWALRNGLPELPESANTRPPVAATTSSPSKSMDTVPLTSPSGLASFATHFYSKGDVSVKEIKERKGKGDLTISPSLAFTATTRQEIPT